MAVHKLRFEHTISTLCRVLRVNRSTYYKHFHSPPAPRTIENQEIRSKILTIYANARKRYGCRKIKARLYAEYGIKISLGRVHRLMKSMDLPQMSTTKPAFKSTKNTDKSHCQKVLQDSSPKTPNHAWVSDISYIKTACEFAYLCVIIDLFSRRVIAWQVVRESTQNWLLTRFCEP